MSDVALRFGAVDDGLNAQFSKVNKQLDQFKASANEVAGSIGSTFKAVGVIAAAAGFGKLISEGLELADVTKKIHDQTGFTTDSVQRLSFISGQASVDVGSLTGGVLKLQRVMGGFEEGSEKSADALERLGLANANFRNQSPEQQFETVARAVSGLADQNQRVLATTELFGKSGAELLPVLTAVGEESAKLDERFAAIGGPVGQGAIEVVDELGDTLSESGLAAKSLATELLAIGAPPVIATLKGVNTLVGSLRFAISGPSDEQGKLQARIENLQFELDLQHSLEVSDKARVKSLGLQLEEAKALQATMFGFAGGVPALQLAAFPTTLSDPLAGGGPAFQETDEAKKAREKEESDLRRDRLGHLAEVHQLEQDMEFKQSLVLHEINAARFEKDLASETDRVSRSLRIQTDAQSFLASVRQTFGLQEIKFEEIKSQSVLQIATTMFGSLAAQNSKLARIQQGIALAQTIWSTGAGIMKAFETLPWPASLAAAAKVAITGAIQVAKIKSTNYSAGSVSGTAPTLAGGGTAVGAAQDSQTPDVNDLPGASGATTVYISGFITQDVIDQMLSGLRDGFDRDVVLIPSNSLQAQVLRGQV